MGRHSDGKNNYSLSGWVIGAIVAVIVLIALLIWWLWPSGNASDGAAGGEEEAANECIQGKLALPIATDAASEEATRQLLDDWAATDPVVRDYCVVPELSDDLAGAAAYVGVTNTAVEDSGRGTATSSGTPVAAIPVGVAAAEGEDPANAAVDAVSFPVADQPGLSQVVASALAADREEALNVLNRDSELTSAQAAEAPLWASTESAAGESFTELANIEASAIALTADGDVTEEQERAAAAFVEQAGEQYQAPEGGAESVDTQLLAELDGSADTESEAETTTPETTTTEAPAPAAVEAADTLFVLDTSQYMEGSMGSLGAAVQDSAARLTGTGESVALWNYSSPLNPGVTQGWRQNLGFGANPEEVGEVVGRFGTGGVPQSRSATVAAVNVARNQAASTGQSVRVVVVTTGTESDMSDEVFANSLNTGDGVELTVIHVGTGQADPVLAEAAAQSYDLDGLGQLPATLNEAAGV